MPVVPTPITGSQYDLCAASYATSALAAGGVALSTAQSAILPTLITAASKAIARFCNRPFVLTPYVEIVSPEGARQDRGEPASAKLSYFPVRNVSRCATNRSTVLLVRNADTVTNQEAFLQFSRTGDPEYFDLVYTGLNLTRTASGTQTVTGVPWTTASPFTTIDSVAASINGLGGGWQATVQQNAASNPNLGQLPAAYLVGVREPKPAQDPGVGLDVFAQSMDGYDVDPASGIVHVYWNSTWGTGWGGMGAGGDPLGGCWDGAGGFGGGSLSWPQVQVSYTAGFATVPESLQQVCAELVKATLDRLRLTNVNWQSHSVEGQYAYAARQAIETLPEWATQVLHFYKDWLV